MDAPRVSVALDSDLRPAICPRAGDGSMNPTGLRDRGKQVDCAAVLASPRRGGIGYAGDGYPELIP